jgi:hypothetical protein
LAVHQFGLYFRQGGFSGAIRAAGGLLTGDEAIYQQFSAREISCLTHCKIADKKAAS